MFSNAVDHASSCIGPLWPALPMRHCSRRTIRKFASAVGFDALEPGRDGARPVQRGTCTLPGGETVSLVVNDERGASIRTGHPVSGGLRFFRIPSFAVAGIRPIPNLLQHDNVLCIVIEFDTRRVLDPAKGSLFGAVAETAPAARLQE